MKKCNKAILPISIIAFSFALVSLNHALSLYLNSSNASDITMNISGIKDTDTKYYLYWNGSTDGKELSTVSGTKYSSTVDVADGGTYSYAIKDQNGKVLCEKDSINLALTGEFDLSFDSTSKDSSLTYSFSLEDSDNTFGANPYCYPSSDSYTATEWWITGSFCSWNLNSAVQMYTNPSNTSNKGLARHVYLEEGDVFKIRDTLSSDTTYFDFSKVKSLISDSDICFSSDNSSHNNIKVLATGYYDICLNKDNEIHISHSTDTECIQGLRNGTKTTFTLDATKYASSTTYLAFFGDAGNRKSSENALATTALSSATKSTCSIMYNNNILFNPGVWNTDGAWFLAELTDGTTTERYELTSFEETDFYKASVPSSSFGSLTFYRMTSASANNKSEYLNGTKELVKVDGENDGYWNKTSSLIYSHINSTYQITGWDEGNCSETNPPQGASIYTITPSTSN